MNTIKPTVNVILRRSQQGPMARFARSIFHWANDLSYRIIRNSHDQSQIDHFISFAEMYRAVRRGYDLNSSVIKMATVHHLDKLRRHKHFSAIFEACHTLFVVSDPWKQHLVNVEGVDEKKIKIIYNGVQFDDILPMVPLPIEEKNNLRDEFGIRRDSFVVGHLGRESEWRKDCPTYYKALDYLSAAGEKIFPVFLENSSYSSGRHSFGDIGYHRYRDIYNIMDAYVISSVVEGGPLGYIEATACGIPVVSTSVGMVNDFHKHWFFAKGNHIQLAEHIRTIKHNAEYARLLALEERESISWLTWEWTAKEHHKTYAEALGHCFDV